jgi:phage terminase small subunit
MADELNYQQKLFADEYLIDLNATQAAIRAGYSKKTAAEMGYENLNKPHIKAYIAKRMKDREKRTEITQDMVLQELAKIGFVDIKSYLKYCTEKVEVDFDEVANKPIYGYKQIIDMKDSDDVDGAVISEVSLGKDGTFKFKLYDKVSALKEMGKHLGVTEKTELSGKIDLPQIIISK